MNQLRTYALFWLKGAEEAAIRHSAAVLSHISRSAPQNFIEAFRVALYCFFSLLLDFLSQASHIFSLEGIFLTCIQYTHLSELPPGYTRQSSSSNVLPLFSLCPSSSLRLSGCCYIAFLSIVNSLVCLSQSLPRIF